MNIKVKTVIIIIITLLLGIVIGAMLNRTLSQNRIKRILSRRNPPVFISFYEKIIEPDAIQREKVRKILNKHAKRFSEIREKSSKELQSSFESMMAELDTILTPEQKKRLEKRRFPGRPPFRIPPFGKTDINEEMSILKEKLGLSEDQSSKIKHILEESRDQALKMSEERGGFRDRMQIFIEIEEKKEKAINKILTKDQKELYEQIKKDRENEMEEQMREWRKVMKKQDFPKF